ncbi:MAG TPA: helix-turn-helix domain-containing protein [Phycisphaerae bacterium]|nr:helix-turn-helix domain-containing protein [Phycisphaerae bacterium]
MGRSSLRPASASKLAKRFGVSEQSLERLGVGFDRFAYSFPMEDGDGQITGYRQRPAKDPGTKLTKAGGKLGIFVPKGVTPATVAVVCESETDLAAALTLGFDGIATPGATAKLDLAADFIARALAPCPCIVFDNDSAGETGADALLGLLAACGVPCRILHPSEPFADLREWYLGGLDAATLTKAIEALPIQYPEKARSGFDMIPNALVDRGLIRRAGPTATAVLLAIGSFADRNGGCKVTRERLAHVAGVDRATIDREKNTLRDLGLLTWRKGGKGTPNVYHLHLGPCKASKQPYRIRPPSPAR